MPITPTRSLRTFAMIGTAVGLFAASLPSSGAIYRTRWDPLFDPTFSSSVGWSGLAYIEVDNACVSPGMTVTFPAGCGAATLLSYSYTFYNMSTPATPFNSGGGAGPGLADPTAVSFDSGGVANGMDLTGLNAITFSLPAGTFSAYGQPNAFNAELAFTIAGGPVLTLTEQSPGSGTYVSGKESCSDCVLDVEWSVPEPGSLALVGAALASLAVFLRRRTAANA